MRRRELNRVFRAIQEMTWTQRRELAARLNAAQANEAVRAVIEDRRRCCGCARTAAEGTWSAMALRGDCSATSVGTAAGRSTH
jgi:hypothetical protein